MQKLLKEWRGAQKAFAEAPSVNTAIGLQASQRAIQSELRDTLTVIEGSNQ